MISTPMILFSAGELVSNKQKTSHVEVAVIVGVFESKQCQAR
jgi:hypothetical protein